MKKILLLPVLVCLSPLAFASTTIDFEQYSAETQITNQYAAQDATFTNALQLVAPGYNYGGFPPHSGNGVITNSPKDPIIVDFATPVEDVTGWYADGIGVTATAYSGLDGSGSVLGVFNGAGVISSDDEFSLNEAGISSITISDDLGEADSLTVDDLSYTVTPETVTPEPDSLILLGTGLLGLVGMVRQKLHR